MSFRFKAAMVRELTLSGSPESAVGLRSVLSGAAPHRNGQECPSYESSTTQLSYVAPYSSVDSTSSGVSWKQEWLSPFSRRGTFPSCEPSSITTT